jgi:phenylpyruvate tautomerase PptA (4-oxalocrotonate tautomerase family)
MEEIKEGNWIIATKPTMEQGGFGFGLMSGGMVENRAYMHSPILVTYVSEAHILYRVANSDKENILPLHEVQARGFIVADKKLIEAVKV